MLVPITDACWSDGIFLQNHLLICPSSGLLLHTCWRAKLKEQTREKRGERVAASPLQPLHGSLEVRAPAERERDVLRYLVQQRDTYL